MAAATPMRECEGSTVQRRPSVPSSGSREPASEWGGTSCLRETASGGCPRPLPRPAPPALAREHAGDPDLTRWRAYIDAPAEPCASCSLRGVCKGGCKVVASFLDGGLSPDPECPRVVDFRLRDRPIE